jgi:hypothetical protein
MKPFLVVLTLLSALPLAARGDESHSYSLDNLALAPPADLPPLERRDGYSPRYGPGRYQPEARQGVLLSIGLGGGSLYLSPEGGSRIGAADLDFRLGYGLSDRFQMFMDFNADAGTTYNGNAVGSWTWTMRAQTVLIGDRAGNGLNVNFGAGFGGLTYNPNPGVADRSSGPTGFALAGGISYDVRITPWCAFSPEFFVTWHQVPGAPDYPDGSSSIYGVRLNLLWYLH